MIEGRVENGSLAKPANILPSEPSVTLLCMDRRYLQARLSNNLSLEQIGHETGLHPSTVAYWAKKHGMRSAGAARFRARGEPDRSTLERLAAAGASLQVIGNELERSVATVRYWLQKWDIERPVRSRRADPASAPAIIDRPCRRHGLTNFCLERRGYYRCMLCRQERVSEWRRRVKRTLVNEAGGKCFLCGYGRCTAALQFHHLDPSQKTFALSDDGVARNIALARAEVAKCVLLCANCHAEVEAGHQTLQLARTGGPR